MALGEGEDLSKILSSEVHNTELIIEELEQQLQELDATEFELPEVSELPTLESILNEPDDPQDIDSESDTELNSAPESEPKASFSSEAETVSVHSRTSSRGSSELLSSLGSAAGSSSARSRREGRSITSSVVRHVALTGIASQLVSAHDRVGAGLPTTMAVGSVICIGTSHGLIMVFDPSQALKWCLGSTQFGEQHGSVSALALSEDGIRLLAGYAKGHLCLFDLTTGNVVQSIVDAHTACTAVLHLKWTDFPNIAIMSDSGGSVFELAVKRTMGLNSNMTRCIFTGSRGEVCTLEPLVMSRFNIAPLLHNVIVAMATITKVIVVSLRPSPKVLFSHSLRASSSSLPLLAWQFVVIQMPNKTRIVDPVLAFGRQHTLYFYQVTHGTGDTLQFLPLRKITTEYLLHNIAWLNPSTLALLDSREQCHVMDVRSQQVIETVDLNSLGLVYASQHFKATATGGNVSRAMAVAGERACYHSMVSFGNQVLLLGTKALQVLTVRNWSERLDQLYENKQVIACLQLARQMVTGKAIAVVGLPHRKSKRKAQLQEKITAIVLSLLDGWHLSAMNHANQVVSELVGACVVAGLHNLLVGTVWEVLQDHPSHKGVFLESLESFILSDDLSYLPPDISQQLLSHYEQLGRLEQLEGCIVRLNVTSLDLHQTMTMCWSHGLYDAIIYVYTKGMKDYVTPLEELTTVLSNALGVLSDEEVLPAHVVTLGNKVLVYVSCCLAGRGYPQGDIEPEYLQQVKYEVFKCLSSVHSKNAEESQKPFPYLRTLLRFDTREFLNVLSLAFEEAEFSSELGLLQRKRLIDVLMQVMSDSSELFSSVQVCSLYTFIARQLARQNSAIPKDLGLINTVVEELCSESVHSMREERQTALLELLQEGALQHLQTTHLLQAAKRAQFWRVCESVYSAIGECEEILPCYLNDQSRLHQVLPYLQHAVNTQTLQQVKDQLLANFERVVMLDASGTASFLLNTPSLAPLIYELVQSLKDKPKFQYVILRALFLHRSSKSGRYHSSLTPSLQLQLVALMCTEDPSSVLPYLKQQPHGSYDIAAIMSVVKQHPGLEECEALLLLQGGKVKEALTIHLRLLRMLLEKMKQWAEDADESETKVLLRTFEGRVCLVIGIIESHCKGVPHESERQELWFPLLDLLLSPPSAPNSIIAAGIGDSCGSAVSAMLSQVSPPAILQRVLKQPIACQADHVLRLMQSLVSRYRYERRVFTAMSGAVRAEQLACVTARVRQKRGSVAGVANTCSVCGLRFLGFSNVTSSTGNTEDKSLIVFNCGHLYHKSCSSSSLDEGCVICSDLHFNGLINKAAVKRKDQQLKTEECNEEKDKDEANNDLKKETTDPELTSVQRENLAKVLELGLTGCRVSLLEQLSQRHAPAGHDPYTDYEAPNSYTNTLRPHSAGTKHDRWLSERFPLRLAPPSEAMPYEDL